ncbi:P-loop containing nucleoside triphosphate hydrolase protein [Blakeslea trispora]|nr:P-loop containing nucleoside triphosphate hydrolase protein [Blakeslea trispora]
MLSLEVLGAGFGRTGTMSLKYALDFLGYKTHHMVSVLTDDTQIPEIFEEAYKDPTLDVDWDRAYQGYNAAVDWPSTAFFDTLYSLCPAAKVILTVRDPESWHSSVVRTIHEWPGVDSTWPDQILRARKMARVVVRDGELGGPDVLGRKEELIRKFMDHTEHIKSIVKPENLLIMNVGEGWEKLCPFLGLPVPQDTPYPHMNKGDRFEDMLLNIKESLEDM